MISTRLTERFDIEVPIVLAPMAKVSGGRLAAAVTGAGGLGLIGGSYCDADWIEDQFAKAGNARVGCGFITWSLAEALKVTPDLLDRVLDRRPAAVFLSFGDPMPFAGRIHAAGVPLIVQVQTLRDAKRAAEAGADVIVAQGAEAGGHGEKRATMTLVPEIADWLAQNAPGILLLAAGGIADGRGLAAALMLGAEGVVVGSRLWATREALVHPEMLKAAVGATGDETIRTTVMDVARRLDWPDRYSCRVLKNPFTERWHDDREGLIAAADTIAPQWTAAWEAGDVTVANTFVGEATGLIDEVRPAATVVGAMVDEAEALLGGGWRRG